VANVLNTLGSDDHGNILVTSRNDGSSTSTVQVTVAANKTFETALNMAILHLESSYPHLTVGSTHSPTELNDWYDGFSYCTWNGLGRELSEPVILDAMEKLTKSGITISNLIIDDNWQSLEIKGSSDAFHYQWVDFEANKKNFLQGLRHLT
jgi:hypothetical protein